MKRTLLASALGCSIACAATLAHAANTYDGETTKLAAPQAIPVPSMPALNRTEIDGGVVIEDLKLGEGLEVTSNSVVVAHYHGTLKANPTVVFDSSFKRGEPIGLPMSQVIPGWQKGVPGMRVGGIRRLTIPAALAYGDRSPSPEIPSNSDLVFVLQILDIMQIEDVVVGKGEPISGRWVALTTFTVRDQNGKIIEKHDASDPYLLVRSEYEAMAFGLDGMMRGGKRRITVPAALNRSNPAFGINRVENTPVTIEVELLNLRLIPPEANAPGC